MSEGIALNYEFKMLMEGNPCPFESAVISCTPNGVEMNVEVHPTDKIYDLKPKTCIHIYYKDFVGPIDQRQWRLLGEGYFSGFAKYDNAAGSRTVSMICRDFRMDIRKTPSAFVYQPDEHSFDKLYLMNRYGLKRRYTVNSKDATNNHVNITSRTYGGNLRPFGNVIDIITGTATGDINNGIFIGKNSKSLGRFLLDAFCRSLWMETTDASTYGTFVNSRIRADKKMIIPENNAGYRFFSIEYLNAFGTQVIFNNSMFSSIESVMMRMAAIFQCSPISCSTPNLIPIEEAMCPEMSDYIKKTPGLKFGSQYITNQCMILPPMQFTAPPNCNVFFPCMYDIATWQHDYDSDITRGYFKVNYIFGGNDELNYHQIEVPNSLLDFNRKDGDTPPLTIEERFKGSNIMEGDVDNATAARTINDDFADQVYRDPAAYLKLKATTGKEEIKLINNVWNNLKSSSTGSVFAQSMEIKKKQLTAKLTAATSVKGAKPSLENILGRHAIFKFLMNKYSSRIISMNSSFNPYAICGFPGVILADDNRQTYKTSRSIIGQIVTIKHTINAQGDASTNIVMNCARFISDPTDMDKNGNALFVGDTNTTDAKVDPSNYIYVKDNGTRSLQNGFPIDQPVDIAKDSKILDWDNKKNTTAPKDPRTLKWAKDILLITREGSEEGKTNLNFTDERYVPNKVGIFYKQTLGQDQANHFMLGTAKDDSGKPFRFLYDSMHEAFDVLTRSNMMNDYNSAIEFVNRPVVTENDYNLHILGSSFLISVDNGVKIYTNLPSEFKNRIDNFWYGKPTSLQWSIMQYDKDYDDPSKKGYINDGDYSSVYEKGPITVFVKERIESALDYIKEVNKRVNSTR